MAEQEKREKAIEEMARYIGNCDCGKFHNCENCMEKDYMFCNQFHLAKGLYDAGYRKADKDSVFQIDISEELTKDFFQNEIEDSRKEAINEFVETVKRCLPNEPYLHTHIREIASIKFGVEVEE